MTDVTLQAKVNGGTAQTGAVIAEISDVIGLTAADKAGWNGASTRWELWTYPFGFPLPSGWTLDNDDPIRPTYYVLGNADPPTFTVDRWGEYGTRLRKNGTIVDERTVVLVDSINGLRPVGRMETTQRGGPKLARYANIEENFTALDLFMVGHDHPLANADNPGFLSSAQYTALFGPQDTLARTGTVVPNGAKRYHRVGNGTTEKITGDLTIDNPTATAAESTHTIILIGDGTHTVTWDAVYKFGTGGLPNAQPPATPGDGDRYRCVFDTPDGTTFYCAITSLVE